MTLTHGLHLHRRDPQRSRRAQGDRDGQGPGQGPRHIRYRGQLLEGLDYKSMGRMYSGLAQVSILPAWPGPA